MDRLQGLLPRWSVSLIQHHTGRTPGNVYFFGRLRREEKPKFLNSAIASPIQSSQGSLERGAHADTRLLEVWPRKVFGAIRATRIILPHWIPLVPLMDKEIVGTGVSIKEERRGVIEEIYLEIKEEPLDHVDEARDEVSEVKVESEFLAFNDLEDPRNEASEKDLCDTIEDCNTLKAPYVVEENEKKGSLAEDQAKQEESHEEVTHRKVNKKFKFIVCEVCGKTIYRERYIKIHMRVHTKEKPFTCDICSKNFTQKSSLVKHMRVHTNKRPYNCEICNKDFAEKYGLERHKRVHTKEKPYICEICNRAFAQNNERVRHIRLHTKEKPYSCQICNKTFTRNSSRVEHMKVHTKEKPYGCNTCKKVFALKSTLVRHMKVHTKEKL